MHRRAFGYGRAVTQLPVSVFSPTPNRARRIQSTRKCQANRYARPWDGVCSWSCMCRVWKQKCSKTQAENQQKMFQKRRHTVPLVERTIACGEWDEKPFGLQIIYGRRNHSVINLCSMIEPDSAPQKYDGLRYCFCSDRSLRTTCRIAVYVFDMQYIFIYNRFSPNRMTACSNMCVLEIFSVHRMESMTQVGCLRIALRVARK